MRTLLLFGYTFCLSNISLAQQSYRNCAAINQFYDKAKSEELEIFTKNYIKPHHNAAKLRGKITIPVVIHIVNNWTTFDTIADCQIYAQIEALNRDFNRQNNNLNQVHPDFINRIANVGFNFCLANISPNGEPTNGITRKRTSFELIATGNNSWIYHSEEGGQDAWDTKQYLNIWVTQMTVGIAGFGSKPGEKNTQEDGVILSPRFFGMGGTATLPFHLGRTGVHEVAHYFNLSHPFDNGCEGNDFVEDVPQQLNAYRDCQADENISCGSRDNITNFMNYSGGECLAMFTTEQAMRMQAALIGARYGLLTSKGCSQSIANPPSNEIKIYPNPASYYFCVETGDLAVENIPFKMFDSKGTRIIEGMLFPNQIQHFPTKESGVYFLQIFDNEKDMIVKKVLVNQ